MNQRKQIGNHHLFTLPPPLVHIKSGTMNPKLQKRNHHLITPHLVANITPLQECRFDIKMTTVSGALNNLLETATLPEQRPGNALVNNNPKTNSIDFSRHRLHQINKNSQKLLKYQQAWKLITPGRVYKTASPISAFRYPT